jgi:signal transduction histidine kinase
MPALHSRALLPNLSNFAAATGAAQPTRTSPMWPSTLRVGPRSGRLLRRLSLFGIALACLAGISAWGQDPTLRPKNDHHTIWTVKQGASTTITAIARPRDSRLWLGIAAGLYRFDSVRFAKFASADRPIPLGSTPLSFTMPERLRLRYRLDGVDKGWQDAGTRRAAFYPQLGAGAYRFRVIAFKKEGVPSLREFSVPITLRPTTLQATWFLLLCALALLILLTGLVYWRTRYLARRLVKRLQERVAERERIARALHDSLLQNIQGLILRLHAALKPLPKGSEARATIESILDQADVIMKEAREELLDLGAGQEKGAHDLGHALATFGQSLQEQFGPRFRMVVTGDARTLNVSAWHELYLIGREALFNAYQHARASNVEVEVVYGSESFALFIRDDGRGMDESAPCGEGRTRHWGLAGMKERARGLEGALELWSRQHAGTELVARAPGRVVYAPADRPGLGQHLLAILSRSPR